MLGQTSELLFQEPWGLVSVLSWFSFFLIFIYFDSSGGVQLCKPYNRRHWEADFQDQKLHICPMPYTAVPPFMRWSKTYKKAKDKQIWTSMPYSSYRINLLVHWSIKKKVHKYSLYWQSLIFKKAEVSKPGERHKSENLGKFC